MLGWAAVCTCVRMCVLMSVFAPLCVYLCVCVREAEKERRQWKREQTGVMDLRSNVVQQVGEMGPRVAMEMAKPDQYSGFQPGICDPSPPNFVSSPSSLVCLFVSISPSTCQTKCVNVFTTANKDMHNDQNKNWKYFRNKTFWSVMGFF